MIILRQKLYTFKDRQVIHELWDATKGGREFPRGFVNLYPRDNFRLDTISKGFNAARESGNLDNVNWGEFRTLATHMGLPKTAEGGEHLIRKYTNPELIERYKSIKAHRAGLGKEYKEYKELNDRFRQISERFRKAAQGDLKSAEGINEYVAAEADFNNFLMANRSGHTRLERLRNKLNKSMKPSNRFKKKQEKFHKIALKESDSIAAINRDDELYSRLKQRLENSGHKVIEDSRRRSVTQMEPKGDIVVGNKSIGDISHEGGHHSWLQRTGYDADKKGLVSGRNSIVQAEDPFPLARLVEENGASASALATLKQQGAPQETIDLTRRELENSGKTYYHDTLYRIYRKAHDKFRY